MLLYCRLELIIEWEQRGLVYDVNASDERCWIPYKSELGGASGDDAMPWA